jgi:hypothetical protein
MRMRAIRMTVLVLVLSALSGLMAQAAEADEAAAIYNPGTVVFIDLTLSSTEKAKLEANSDEYVKATFSLTKSSDGTPAGEESSPFIAPRPAEIRLKGNVGGSFRDLSGKAAFKLKFKKTEPMLGLRKMTLNNMVQDPSMLHETLAYAAFRAAGVPAPRTGYAYVRLNGEDLGVYMDLETLDETALAQIFGGFDKATQHLYEGEDGHDLKPGEAEEFEVDEGEEGPGKIGDLEALIAAVNAESGEGESWSEQVAPNADLAEMTKMWAVEKYIDHWDGYSGHTDATQAGERPNNYYLYSEPAGRFQMLPWGADQTWIATIGVETPGREVTFDGPGGVLFNKCLEDEDCFRSYWEALRKVTNAIVALDPQSLAEGTDDLLAPWQAEEIAHGRPEYDADEIKEDKYGVDTTFTFIAGRRAEAKAWLAENKPPKPERIVDKGGPGPPPPPEPTEPKISFGGVKRSGRQLTTRVQLSAAGQVSLRAIFKADKKQKRACTTSGRVQAAGVFALRCSLSRAAVKRLAGGALRLKLIITIAPDAGGKETIVQRIRLARS